MSDSMPIRVGDDLVWQSAVPHIIFSQRIPSDDPIVLEYDCATSRGDSTIRLRCHYSPLQAAREGVAGLLQRPDCHSVDLGRVVYGKVRSAEPILIADAHPVGDINHRADLAECLAELVERSCKIGAVWSRRMAIVGYTVPELAWEYVSDILAQIAETGLSDSESVEIIGTFTDSHIRAGVSRCACRLRGYSRAAHGHTAAHEPIGYGHADADSDSDSDADADAVIEFACPGYDRDAHTGSADYPRPLSRQRYAIMRRRDSDNLAKATLSAIVDVYA